MFRLASLKAAPMVASMSLAPSFSIFRHQGYRHYWIARQLISAERQMVAVAIGWQVYTLARETRSVEESAFLLGIVGLAQFVPVFLLSLVGGQAADRYDRKMILIVSNLVRLTAIAGLFIVSALPASIALPCIFALAAAMGVVNAFTPAASNALYPKLVPRDELPLAIAWNSLGFNMAAILGPAVGGFLLQAGLQTVYATAAAMTIIAIATFWTARTPRHRTAPNVRSWSMIIEGLRYVRDNKTVLGAISLDLIVVFFGGVTALLPVFAKDILHVGAFEFSLLRAAPAVGAAIVAVWLATRPLARKVGAWMLAAVAIYGAAMLGVAFSTILLLSIVMLAVTGAADMISVYVRQSLIQLATPDEMRGRVSSVSYIFIAASNELGEFQSGVAARFLGPVGAVILGGGVAIVTALAWTRLFPALSGADRFEDAAIDRHPDHRTALGPSP